MTRRFSTADLENLTESADDGPWEFAADYGEVASYYGPVAKEVDDHNFPLIAASRELAADYHRVRTELEQLREGYLDMARAELADGHDRSGQWHADVAFAITRILNGGDDEE